MLATTSRKPSTVYENECCKVACVAALRKEDAPRPGLSRIDQDLRLNRARWILAEQLKALKH
jgi:hypothetical protein